MLVGLVAVDVVPVDLVDAAQPGLVANCRLVLGRVGGVGGRLESGCVVDSVLDVRKQRVVDGGHGEVVEVIKAVQPLAGGLVDVRARVGAAATAPAAPAAAAPAAAFASAFVVLGLGVLLEPLDGVGGRRDELAGRDAEVTRIRLAPLGHGINSSFVGPDAGRNVDRLARVEEARTVGAPNVVRPGV